jgi:hypothetical protein
MDTDPSALGAEETIPDYFTSPLYYYLFEAQIRGEWIDFTGLACLAGLFFTIEGYYSKKLKLNFKALCSLKETLSDQDIDRILGDRSLPLDSNSWEIFCSASSDTLLVATNGTISDKAVNPRRSPCVFILRTSDGNHFVSNILVYRTGRKFGYQELGSALTNRFKERDPWFLAHHP